MTKLRALLLAAALPLALTAGQAIAQPQPAARAPVVGEFHRFRIGGLQAVALRDGLLQAPNDGQAFVTGATPAEAAAVLTAAGQPGDHFDLSIEPLLVRAGPRTLLFDTGAGSNMGGVGGRLPASLAAAGVAPRSVTDIFISHTHGDHTGGLVDAEGRLVFANARIHISVAEWDALRARLLTSRGPAAARLQALVAAMQPKVVTFRAGATLIPGLVRAVDIRGHTPGHSAYRITSGRSTLLYIGDAMHHFITSVQRPEWRIDYDADHAVASASRAALLRQLATSHERIYAGHFPFPGIGRIARRATGFVWVPER